MQHRIPLVKLSGLLLSSILASPILVNRLPTSVQNPSHLILVVDRSGSMYGSMAELRQQLSKLLTLSEYKDADLSVSLISYSGTGDCTTHFDHVRVSDIMAPNSPQQKAIQSLEATFLTCISQGLDRAVHLVRSGETTVIMLHSDGYANDSSPHTERTKLEALSRDISKLGGVILNTVAYGWADFPLLDRLASFGGGKAVQAKGPREVFDALQESMKVAAGNVAPATRVTAKGKRLLAISRSAGKVMTGVDELLIRGLKPEDDLLVAEIGEIEHGVGSLPTDHNADRNALALALARIFLSEGKINEAKMLVLGARAENLYPHLRALSATDLGAFAETLDRAIEDPSSVTTTNEYGVRAAGPSIMEVMEILRLHLDGFQVHLPTLRDGYSKRSERREEGVWEDGTLVRPRFKTAAKEPNAEWFKATSIDQNQTNATINIKLAYGINLVGRENDVVVREVEGITLDHLSNFRAYTLVGDGSANTPNFRIRITDKRLERALGRLGYSGDDVTFHFNQMNVIPLGEVGSELVADENIVNKLVGIKTAISLLSAATTGTSAKYNATKLAALKDHNLSGELYVNFPTTTPWKDDEERKEWIRTGRLDSYTTYTIGIGTPEMPVIKLRSGNDMLGTFALRVEDEGKKKKDIKAPKMPEIFTTAFKPSGKDPESTKDQMQKPWLDQLLGFANTGPWKDLLEQADVDGDDIERFLGWKNITNRDDQTELFIGIRKKLERFQDLLFAQVMAPTVMYMGSTGFLPDGIQAKAMTPEQVTDKYKVKLGKDESQATYYLLEDGKRLLSVMPEVAWFTTQAVA